MERRSATPSRNPSSSSTTRMRPGRCWVSGFTESARNGILHRCCHARATPGLTYPEHPCGAGRAAGASSEPRHHLDLPGCFEYTARAFWRPAEVVELVDTPDSGSGGGNPVEVRVLSSAPRRPWSPIPERVQLRRCRDSKAPLEVAEWSWFLVVMCSCCRAPPQSFGRASGLP